MNCYDRQTTDFFLLGMKTFKELFDFLIIFSGKPIGSEEFLNRMVEALGIIIDRRSEGRPRKMES